MNDSTAAVDATGVGGNASAGPGVGGNASAGGRDIHLARAEVALQATIFAIAVSGNVCVLVALRYRKRKTSRMHIFIQHLSVADLLVALFNILPQMLWDATFPFRGGDALCRAVTYMQVMVIYLSSYVLLLTALDRYRAICRPMSNYSWTPRRLHMLTAGVWALAALLSVPQLFIFRMRTLTPASGGGGGLRDCRAEFRPEWTLQLYVTAFAVLVYFIPLALLATLYGRICYKIWWNVQTGGCAAVYRFNGSGHISVVSDRSADGGRPAHSAAELSPTLSTSSAAAAAQRQQSRVYSRSKIKTIKMTFVVILAYLVCWLPSTVVQLWWAYDADAPTNHYVFVLCILLPSLNSCCNPLIYLAFSGALVREALPCCPRRRHRHRRAVNRLPPPPPLLHSRTNRRPLYSASMTFAEKAAAAAAAAAAAGPCDANRPFIARGMTQQKCVFCDRRQVSRRELLSGGMTPGRGDIGWSRKRKEPAIEDLA